MEVDSVDKMVHCLVVRRETRAFSVSMGPLHTDTRECDAEQQKSDEERHVFVVAYIPSYIRQSLYPNSATD